METFRTRLLELIQKSRKACRLYASMGKYSGRVQTSTSDLTDLQAEEWRRVNVELATRLGESFDRPDQRRTAIEVLGCRDAFDRELTTTRSDIEEKMAELVTAAGKEDFVTTATVSRDLVTLKARAQALEAACHEIDQVVKRSKMEGAAIELPEFGISKTVESENKAAIVLEVPVPKAKIIPLRKMIG